MKICSMFWSCVSRSCGCNKESSSVHHLERSEAASAELLLPPYIQWLWVLSRSSALHRASHSGLHGALWALHITNIPTCLLAHPFSLGDFQAQEDPPFLPVLCWRWRTAGSWGYHLPGNVAPQCPPLWPSPEATPSTSAPWWALYTHTESNEAAYWGSS